jgi:hypothetical protein
MELCRQFVVVFLFTIRSSNVAHIARRSDEITRRRKCSFLFGIVCVDEWVLLDNSVSVVLSLRSELCRRWRSRHFILFLLPCPDQSLVVMLILEYLVAILDLYYNGYLLHTTRNSKAQCQVNNITRDSSSIVIIIVISGFLMGRCHAHGWLWSNVCVGRLHEEREWNFGQKCCRVQCKQ